MAKRRHSSRVWLVIGILVVAGCAGWWFQREHRAAAAPSPTPTARAIRRSFSSTVLATGAVKPQVGAEVRVGARVSGKVERLHANIGDRVKAGDVIAELQNDDLEAMVAQRQAELRLAETKLASLESLYPTEVEQAQADVEKWQATADRAAKDLSREEDLLGKDSTSVQSRDLAQEQGRVARAQLASSLKTLELIQKRHAEELKQGETECARAR
ncbi:MAG: biotin/lipoyl-binding protein, partial [Candidatus Sumerlaeota bacterium]|nr:biotin/lipoyl-binding protein [Candidatus Sumerlaeota bacterium]